MSNAQISESGDGSNSNCELHRELQKDGEAVGMLTNFTRNLFHNKLSGLWIFGKSEHAYHDKSVETVTPLIKPKQFSVKTNVSNSSTNCFEAKNSNNVEYYEKILSPTYYAVSLPNGNLDNEDVDKPLVYTDKKEALQAMKKCKGARFKAFTKENDAYTFASQPADEICLSPASKNILPLHVGSLDFDKSSGLLGEKPSLFKGPKSQDMVKLRKAIENGDVEYFNEMVWSNPRYLISSGDTPSIMQEGFRYNALHVAAKHKQPTLCQLILDTIEDSKFMELLYNDDTDIIRTQRITFITDLYLNMPDKGLCETPLHFAAKFGCVKSVRVLVSHPGCDKNRKNKYGLEARAIICERCPASSVELKKQIDDAFEDQCFVPVMRSKDNSFQPVICEPFSPSHLNLDKPINLTSTPTSPRDPSLVVMALAGPMAPKQAKMFYKKWKTPPSPLIGTSETRYWNMIRLSDTEKGLERIGRNLAYLMKTPWTEYWPSLDVWCDLRTAEGLQNLENHLKKMHDQLTEEALHFDCYSKLERSKEILSSLTENFQSSMPERGSLFCESPELSKDSSANILGNSNSSSNSSSSLISQLCRGLQKFHLNESNNSIVTSPDMPSLFDLHGNTSSVSEGNEKICKVLEFESGNESEQSLSTSNKINDNVKRNESLTESSQISSDKTAYGKISLNVSKELDFALCQSIKLDSETLTPNRKFIKEQDRRIHKSKFSNNETQLVIKIISQSLLEVLGELSIYSPIGVTQEVIVQRFLKEDVLPHMTFLQELKFDCDEQRKMAHYNIAATVYESAQKTLIDHEIKHIYRYLMSYLESHFSEASSDEEVTSARSKFQCNDHNPKLRTTIKWQHLKCILTFFCDFLFCSEFNDSSVISKMCQCHWINNQSKEICCNVSADNIKPELIKKGIDFKKSSKIIAAVEHERGQLCVLSECECSEKDKVSPDCAQMLNVEARNNCPSVNETAHLFCDKADDEDEKEDVFVTPPSSPRTTSSCSTPVEISTPDEGLEVYVEGLLPSKADADILRTIKNIFIDPQQYPYVYRWRHLISSFDKEIVEKWPSPAGKKFHQQVSSMKPRKLYHLCS